MTERAMWAVCSANGEIGTRWYATEDEARRHMPSNHWHVRMIVVTARFATRLDEPQPWCFRVMPDGRRVAL